jgi:lysophospholipase L1-like esterase
MNNKKISVLKNGLYLSLILNLIIVPYMGYKLYRKIMKNRNYHFHTEHFIMEKAGNKSIIFIGNSLTRAFPLQEMFGDTNLHNWGINGDMSKGLLYRLDALVDAAPDKVFIMIGVNDLLSGISLSHIIENYEKIIVRIRKSSSRTKIFIQSNLPVAKMQSYDINPLILKLNAVLQMLAARYQAVFLDIHGLFVSDGALNPTLSSDGLHLNREGYRIWKEAVEKYVE